MSPAACAARIPRHHDRAGIAPAAHYPEYIVIEAVDTDVDAVQTGLAERGDLFLQQYTVGRQGQIVDALDLRQSSHQFRKVGAQQRLAAGEPDLVRAIGDEQSGQTIDLLKRKPRRARQERVMLRKFVGGHAVGAAEVTAVDHRYPQIPDRPAEFIANCVVGVTHRFDYICSQ